MNLAHHPTLIWLTHDLRRLGVFISLLLSVWVILTNDTINVDGILYLDVAHQIGLGNWEEAIKLYRWPFYPILIALFSKITFLELEASANIINSAIYAGIIWIFLSILKELNASKMVMVFGLLIICIHPYINEYRADILRDAGFWLFFLWSMLALIKLEKKQRWQDAILWGATISVATLFRIEGAVYALLAPTILLFNKKISTRARANNYFMAMSVPAVLGLIALLGIIGGWVPGGRLTEIGSRLGQFIENITTTIPGLGQLLTEHVLNNKSSDFGVVGMYAIFLAIFILMVVKRSTVFLLAAGCYTLLNKQEHVRPPHLHILAWFAVLNMATLLMYVISEHFLSSRFAMPTALVVALLATFALGELFKSKNGRASIQRKALKIVAIFFIAIMALDGLVSFGHSKRYMREAGYWVKNNLPKDGKLITNHLVINHYAGRREARKGRRHILSISKKLSPPNPELKIQPGDILAIHSKDERPKVSKELVNQLDLIEVKRFDNSHDGLVTIYRKK